MAYPHKIAYFGPVKYMYFVALIHSIFLIAYENVL